jgi:predicted transcriptional regulator
MIKKTLAARLDPDLISRLKELSKAKNATIDRTISMALDALEREQKAGNSFSERVAFLEKNLSALLGLVVAFSEKIDQKFSEASTNERDRLKSLFKLVDIKISEHDEAEEVRFHRCLAGLGKVNSP